ncbi:MAG: hypothetical protein EXX96DRAFT_571140 [Benjaminiella poitrasii]|nr:MAG: hypothetical protein EXX96DRAFT_571140 [Benjaminiella poitrasii]
MTLVLSIWLQPFFLNNLESHRDSSNTQLLFACRTALTIDAIFWLPISYVGCGRALRWCLDWLYNGRT